MISESRFGNKIIDVYYAYSCNLVDFSFDARNLYVYVCSFLLFCNSTLIMLINVSGMLLVIITSRIYIYNPVRPCNISMLDIESSSV
jgi:hypothetical protein